jgi:hypothetical protein
MGSMSEGDKEAIIVISIGLISVLLAVVWMLLELRTEFPIPSPGMYLVHLIISDPQAHDPITIFGTVLGIDCFLIFLVIGGAVLFKNSVKKRRLARSSKNVVAEE